MPNLLRCRLCGCIVSQCICKSANHMSFIEMELRVASQLASSAFAVCSICGKDDCDHTDFDVVKASRGDLHKSPTGRIRKLDTTAIEQAQTITRKCISSVIQGSQAECVAKFESSPMIARAFKENRIDNMRSVMGTLYGAGPIEAHFAQIENNARIEQLYSKLGVIVYEKCKDHYPCRDFTEPENFMTDDELDCMCKNCVENGVCGVVKNISNLLKISVDKL